ncbi:OmpA family protein [Stigmatella sp. ncwal1]|uniref:Peptidoglycan-associated lipoprotein n=1 Tax=Stigmatella ashevillensis TaxID=2995309 RepID=A0ABT5D7F8_9BACT|nr:OmpA family protein [Stigmatella ashevillena]MDC0708197.1 OmpA family protein [Stigmatella ashevillena]
MRSSLLPWILIALSASACATKSAATVSHEGLPGAASPRPPPAPVAEKPAESDEDAGRSSLAFGPIYYELDSTTLRPESRETLDQLAEALRQRPGARVTISGHTCELGTTEYNLMLGQRRAAMAKDYLVKLGVGPGSVSVVSYGEESPAVLGSGEEVWSRNRRSEFNVSVAQARMDVR